MDQLTHYYQKETLSTNFDKRSLNQQKLKSCAGIFWTMHFYERLNLKTNTLICLRNRRKLLDLSEHLISQLSKFKTLSSKLLTRMQFLITWNQLFNHMKLRNQSDIKKLHGLKIKLKKWNARVFKLGRIRCRSILKIFSWNSFKIHFCSLKMINHYWSKKISS